MSAGRGSQAWLVVCSNTSEALCSEVLEKLTFFSQPCRKLDDARLQSLGVFDANHRRSILHKAQAASEADLDNVLTDLTSVIADLEAFTVVSHVRWCPQTLFVWNWLLRKHVLVVWAVSVSVAN